MSEAEAVLLLVQTSAADPRVGMVEMAVAALADVPVVALGGALAELLVRATPGPWVLTPRDGERPWPPDATLRGLGVPDGTTVVLRRAQPDDLSGARS